MMAGFHHPLSEHEARLWQLIDARSQPGADVAAIDQQLWDEFGEHGAVMFTDLSGFARLTAEFGSGHFLQIIYQSQQLFLPLIDDHAGRVIEIVGDSMLIWFGSPLDAVHCGIKMQRACHAHNTTRDPHLQVLLAVGIGYGRILRAGFERLAGIEVNAASKLGEDFGKAHDILVTESVKQAVGHEFGDVFELTGIVLAGAGESYRMTYAATDNGSRAGGLSQ